MTRPLTTITGTLYKIFLISSKRQRMEAKMHFKIMTDKHMPQMTGFGEFVLPVYMHESMLLFFFYLVYN